MLTQFPKRYSELDPRNWLSMARGDIDQNTYLPEERQLFNKLREKYVSIFGREFHVKDDADERAIYSDFFAWSGNQKKPYLIPNDAYFAIEGGDVNGSYFGNTCPIVTFYGKEACRNFLAWRIEQSNRNSFGRSYENSPRMLTAAFFIDAIKKLSHLPEAELLANEKISASGLRYLERCIEFAGAINNDDFFPTSYKTPRDVNMQWALQNFKKYTKKIIAGINAYRLNKTARDYFGYLSNAIASIQNNIGRCFLYLLAEQEISQAAIDYVKEDHAEWKNIQNTFAQQVVFYILSPYRLDAISKGNCNYDVDRKLEELIQKYFREESANTICNGLPYELLQGINKDQLTKNEFLGSMRNVIKLILALNGMRNMLEAAIKLAGSEGDRGIYLGTDLIINKLLPAISKHMDALNRAFEVFSDFIGKFSDKAKETRGNQTLMKIGSGRQHNLIEATKISSIIKQNLSNARVHGTDFAQQIDAWQSRPEEMLVMLNAAKDSYKKNWQAYQLDLKRLGIDFTPINTNWSRMPKMEREHLLSEWSSENPSNVAKISSKDFEDSLENRSDIKDSLANSSCNSDLSNHVFLPILNFSEYLFGKKLIWQIFGWLSCLFIVPIFYAIYKINQYHLYIAKQHEVVTKVETTDKTKLTPEHKNEEVINLPKEKEVVVSSLSETILNYYGPKGELGVYIKQPGWKKYLLEKVSVKDATNKGMIVFEAIQDLANNRISNLNLSPKVCNFILDPSRLGVIYVILWAMLEAEFENGGKMTAKDAQFFIKICRAFEENQLMVTKSAERIVSQNFALGKVFSGKINLLGFNKFNFINELENRCQNKD